MPSGEVVGGATHCGHCHRGLGQFGVETNVKHGGTRVGDCEEGGKIQQTENADKAYVFLVAVGHGAVLDREKDVRIRGGGCLVDPCTGRAVERSDCEVGKIPPVIVEATAPVEH